MFSLVPSYRTPVFKTGQNHKVILLTLVTISLAIVLTNQAEGLKIMTVGDMSCDADSLNVMSNTLSHLKSNIIDRFVFLGDAQDNSYYNCVLEYFKQVDKYTELRIIRGNHEGPANWVSITNTFNVSSATVPYEKIDDVLLVYMNSEIPYKEQYSKVKNVLSNSAKHKIVFIHKPGLSGACKSSFPSTQLMCGFYEKYNPMFKDKEVDCVIQAHLHTFGVFERGSICYMVYGMGGAEPSQTIPGYYSDKKYESSQYGFTVITTTSDKQIHKFYKNNGDTKTFTFSD